MLQNKMKQQALESDYQKQLLKTTIESQEAERKRIASELHDGVGAMLSAAKLNLGFLKTSVTNDQGKESISDTKEMIDSTIETVRRISKDLLPASLEKFGLVEAIKEFSEKVSTKATMVSFQRPSSTFSLTKQDELPVYRLVQEIVNNALKHAKAKNIIIDMRIENKLTINISDDGIGFDIDLVKNDITKGVGLYNIESRVGMLGGTMQLKSEIGNGTSYSIKI